MTSFYKCCKSAFVRDYQRRLRNFARNNFSNCSHHGTVIFLWMSRFHSWKLSQPDLNLLQIDIRARIYSCVLELKAEYSFSLNYDVAREQFMSITKLLRHKIQHEHRRCNSCRVLNVNDLNCCEAEFNYCIKLKTKK